MKQQIAKRRNELIFNEIQLEKKQDGKIDIYVKCDWYHYVFRGDIDQIVRYLNSNGGDIVECKYALYYGKFGIGPVEAQRDILHEIAKKAGYHFSYFIKDGDYDDPRLGGWTRYYFVLSKEPLREYSIDGQLCFRRLD